MQTQTVETNFRALMRKAAEQNSKKAAGASKSPEVRQVRPVHHPRPRLVSGECKERDYQMMEGWLRQNRPNYRLRSLLLQEPLEIVDNICRPDAEQCVSLLQEGVELDAAACGTDMKRALTLATVYEGVRDNVPALPEVTFGQWVAGMEPMVAHLAARRAQETNSAELVAQCILAVLALPELLAKVRERIEEKKAVCSKDRERRERALEVQSEKAEAMMQTRKRMRAVKNEGTRYRRPEGKALGVKQAKTEALEERMWRIAAKHREQRTYRDLLVLREIEAELMRRGVDVFHSKN